MIDSSYNSTCQSISSPCLYVFYDRLLFTNSVTKWSVFSFFAAHLLFLCFVLGPQPIVAAPEFTTLLPEELNVEIGERVELKTVVTGQPEPKVCWLFDEDLLKNSDRHKFTYDGSVATLVIESVAEVEDALVTCVAKNEAGSAECSCDLFVALKAEAPKFTETVKPVSALLESEAVFSVGLEDSTETGVKWYLNDKLIRDRGRYRLAQEGDGRFLFTIEKCKLTDRGVVKCVASNEGGESTCTAELMVAEENSAPGLKQVTSDVCEFMSGEDGRLELLISGSPVPAVEWLKGFKKIQENKEKYQIESSDTKNTLIIKDLKLEDSGTYKCIASNTGGENSLTFTLKVKGTVSYGFLIFIVSFLANLQLFRKVVLKSVSILVLLWLF